jgi:tetratricopeptide (TPR) repeat protein
MAIALGMAVAICFCVGCNSPLAGDWSKDPPPPPSDIAVSIIDEGLLLSWPCVKDATHYTLFWGKSSYDYKGMKDTPACSIIVEGLEKGDLYRFALTSWNSRGESGFSQEIPFVYEKDPQAAEKYIQKGDEFMKKGDFDKAHVYYSTAIRLNPDIPEAYTGRAALHKRLDRLNLAQEDLEKAKDLAQRAR